MAHRQSAPDLAPRDRDRDRPERWDRDRYEFERERFAHDRDNDLDDRFYLRRGGGPPSSFSRPRDRDRDRERERERDDRSSVGPEQRRRVVYDDFEERRRGREEEEDDDFVVRERERERRRVVYDEEPPMMRGGRGRGRGGSPPAEVERSSRVVIEKERFRSPSPARRPGARLIRRQSSLDTFDRKPAKRYWEREREEYGPPARRDDYRVPPYVDIPLPRAKALPPPRVYAERDFQEEIQVSDPHRYGDDDFHAYPEERVREREVVRTTRRTRSRESRATGRRGRSRSSSSSSSSSSSGGTALTTRSEYPKKGKTRIPARLVSKRALIDLGYPFVEEGSTIIVQKALGQQNIDDLLKLSDDYKKSELEIVAARSSAGDIIEERIEHRTEVYEGAAALNVPPPAPIVTTGPIIVDANPPPVEVVKTTVVRDVSPTRSYTTYDTGTSYTGTSYDTYTTTTAPTVILDSRAREVSGHVPVGPIALASHHHHHDPYETEDLRSEIRHLEKQLARRDRSRHRSRHRSLSRGDLVRAERLSTGELVLYEEEIEEIQGPTRAGPRIEKDKRGRLSISVPRYR